ncbi:MAG TPA: hypothetical protein VHM93_05705, partial [Candidatus Acidoferrum sp.]|nr:hypothetical protein [Candidatus Acidoferrum sp.]
LLSKSRLEDTFAPEFWKKLSFFAQLRPKDDILPIRTVYSGKAQNIGLNYLTAKDPVWYAGPDVVASAICGFPGKAVTISKSSRSVVRNDAGHDSGMMPVTDSDFKPVTFCRRSEH